MKTAHLVLPILSAATLATTTTATPILSARDVPNFWVSGLSHGGSGCPQDATLRAAAETSVAPSRSYLAIGISTVSFTAQTPGGIADTRKSCQVTLEIDHADGYQYAVVAGTNSGTVELDDGVTAVVRSLYYFAGNVEQSVTEEQFVGTQRRGYDLEKPVESIWSPCGERPLLNVANSVRVTGDGAGSISGSVDGVATYGIELAWRRC